LLRVLLTWSLARNRYVSESEVNDANKVEVRVPVFITVEADSQLQAMAFAEAALERVGEDMKDHHPDLHGGNGEQLKAINRAYNALKGRK
jgi:predicted ABC-type transport system involved in lysophospholipase L1 biosynthesis ATPase subunit